MMLYAYCLTDDRSSAINFGSGIQDQPVSFMDIRELRVIVSEFDGDLVSVTRKNVANHEEVIRKVLAASTPLPFRFGTLTTREQIGNYVETKYELLGNTLNQVRNCIEMSIKVIWDSATKPSHAEAPRTLAVTPGEGAAFLRAKRAQILGDEQRIEQAHEIETWLKETLKDVSEASQYVVRPDEKLFLSASHLVKRTSVDRYQLAVQSAITERPDLHFLVSGPWAPYSFVDLALEFKSHFGVS